MDKMKLSDNCVWRSQFLLPPQMLLFKSTSASCEDTFSFGAAGCLLKQPKCSAAGYNSSRPWLQRARLGVTVKRTGSG